MGQSPGSGTSPPEARAKDLPAVVQKVLAQLCKDRLEVSLASPDNKEFTIFKSVSECDAKEVIRLAQLDIRAKRAMGSMVGMAVADAMGSFFEFLPAGTKGPHVDPKTFQAVGEYNKFHLKPGQWTDDTSMCLCLADSLLVCDGYDGSDIRVRFWNWWHKGYNNTFRLDQERNDSIGLGGNVWMSLMVMSQGKGQQPPRYDGIGEDAGNGSLMRLAPVPIYFHSDLELAVELSAESSYTTHPGPSAAHCCAFLGFLIVRAITRDHGRRDTAARFLDSAVAEYLDRPGVASQEDLVLLLKSVQPRGSKERCWDWRDPKGPFILETIEARGENYNGYSVAPDYFGSYSLDGLAIALHSMYHTTSFMAAIVKCINFLGDADSTGAICGQIAGAFYGLDAIDSRLVAQLQRWDEGHIALRSALLYFLGADLPDEVKMRARGACLDSDDEDEEEWAVVYGCAELAESLPEGPPPMQPPNSQSMSPNPYKAQMPPLPGEQSPLQKPPTTARGQQLLMTLTPKASSKPRVVSRRVVSRHKRAQEVEGRYPPPQRVIASPFRDIMMLSST